MNATVAAYSSGFQKCRQRVAASTTALHSSRMWQLLMNGFTRDSVYSCSLLSLTGVAALGELRSCPCSICSESNVVFMIAFLLDLVFSTVVGFWLRLLAVIKRLFAAGGFPESRRDFACL